jgi:diguanylate cyclase (GGDEF)-like protein
MPVRLQGVVMALSGYKNSFFLLDGGIGISVDRNDTSPQLAPGEKVTVRGVTDSGRFAPTVIAQGVTITGKGALPKARLYQMDDLANGKQDSQWIAVRGVVRSASVQTKWGRPTLMLQVDIGSGNLMIAHVYDFSRPGWEKLPGSTVTLQGVCGTVFNDRRQFIGTRMFVSSLDEIKVDTPAPADSFDGPDVALDDLLQFDGGKGAVQRVKVKGSVTFSQPGLGLYLQDGHKAVFVRGDEKTPPALGATLEAVGFPASGGNSPILDDAIYRPAGAPQPVAPTPARAAEMIGIDKYGFTAAPFDALLVRLQGRVVEEIRDPKRDQLLLRDDDTFFTARLAQARQSRRPLAAGTLVSVTGICVAEIDETHEAQTFQLLLRSPADIVVLEGVPWWNARHAGWAVAGATAVLFIALAILMVIRRHAELQTLAMSDPLTGLNNRRGFFMIAEHQWRMSLRRKTTLLFFYIDVDRFKQINDTIGHKEGDLVLKQVADLLRSCFRSADIIARMGGDEFVVACEAPPATEETLKSRLLRAVETRNAEPDVRSQLSLSVGVLSADTAMRDLSVGELLTRADELMYAQKRLRNQDVRKGS